MRVDQIHRLAARVAITEAADIGPAALDRLLSAIAPGDPREDVLGELAAERPDVAAALARRRSRDRPARSASRHEL